MAGQTVSFSIGHVAKKVSENLELLMQVAINDDNIDYGEMICVHDGSVEGITAFTERGIESLQEFLADVRSWQGGIRQFLIDQECEPDIIERIMADEPKA